TPDGVTTWNWDTAINGLGLLATATSPDGIVTRWTYDGFSRLSDVTWTVGAESFTISRSYDGFGRLSTVTYPAVPGRAARFAVDYTYSPSGELDAVVEHGSVPASVYHTVLDVDSAGNPTNASGAFPQARLGSGLTVRHAENPNHPGFLDYIESTDPNG